MIVEEKVNASQVTLGTTQPTEASKKRSKEGETAGEQPSPAAPPKRARRASEENADAVEVPAGAEKEPVGRDEEQGEAAQAGARGKEGSKDASGRAVIEEGRIQFFYRPKVGRDEAGSLADVQRFFMLLHPNKLGVKSRLCIIGKKRLPSMCRHERFFGFVETSSGDAEELLRGLGPQTYETKTRGTRHLAAARALGEGTYAVMDVKNHVNLEYKLEVPATPGEAQLEFMIGKLGSFIFVVKNPAGRGPKDPGLAEKAEYSEEKQQEFEQYSWIPLLDYPRCEFLLVGSEEDMPAEFRQKEEEASQRRIQSACNAEFDEECLLEAMREEIQAEKLGINAKPAETGEMA